MRINAEKKDQLSSLFLIIFSVFICLASFEYSIGTLHQPGPGCFPFLVGAILAALSFMNIVRATIEKRLVMAKVESLRSKKKWQNIILTVIVLFAYPYLVRFIGFAPSTLLFFITLFRFIEPKSWTIVLRVATGGTIISYFIFQYWLKIQFPKGIFGI